MTFAHASLPRKPGVSRWLVEGGYDWLAERLFPRVNAQRLMLEYDDARSGIVRAARGTCRRTRSAVLGLVTTKSGRRETVDELAARIEEASAFCPLERLALSPQCGFATSVLGNALTVDDQRAKLRDDRRDRPGRLGMTVLLTGIDLTLDEVVRVARRGASRSSSRRSRSSRCVRPVRSSSTRSRRGRARSTASRRVSACGRTFAIDGGPGALQPACSSADTSSLRAGRLRRTSCGRRCCKLANGFAQGYRPGFAPSSPSASSTALNDGATPHVRMLGSVGQADLAANADLVHGVLEDFELAAGEALVAGRQQRVLDRVSPRSRSRTARRLLDGLDVAGALDLEAFAANPSLDRRGRCARRGRTRASARPLTRLRELLDGSYLWNRAAAEPPGSPHLSRRCRRCSAPPGDALGYVEG